MTTRSQCLIWPFGKGKGRAQVRIGKKVYYVSALICEMVHGPRPSKHEVAHSCGNGSHGCVSSKHVRWATRAENQADRTLHGTSNKGTRNGMNKLTESQVKQIRQLKGKLSQVEIARRFGVHSVTVHHIHTGKQWGWL